MGVVIQCAGGLQGRFFCWGFLGLVTQKRTLFLFCSLLLLNITMKKKYHYEQVDFLSYGQEYLVELIHFFNVLQLLKFPHSYYSSALKYPCYLKALLLIPPFLKLFCHQIQVKLVISQLHLEDFLRVSLKAFYLESFDQLCFGLQLSNTLIQSFSFFKDLIYRSNH